MDTQDAYNNWAATYDTVDNKTRDLEAEAIKSVLKNFKFEKILEIGCGTGKNTSWLAGKCKRLIAVDFSNQMLELAQQKNNSENVEFVQADITKPWLFEKVNLVTCSLVLEHIEDINFVFAQAASKLKNGCYFYVCELHPYKQLQGSRAKFEQQKNIFLLDYFIHHISDYLNIAKQHGFACDNLQEWFDSDEDRSQPPRLISFLFTKN